MIQNDGLLFIQTREKFSSPRCRLSGVQGEKGKEIERRAPKPWEEKEFTRAWPPKQTGAERRKAKETSHIYRR